jgi:serine/threonine-protein kinase HSL1 (negative regulator of Swe1 kinase)
MEEEDDEAIRRRQARKQAGAPSPAKRKGGAPQVVNRPRLTPLGENETLQERVVSPVDRPSAPTPKKASGGTVEESPAARSGKLAIPRGPRPPLSPRPSSYGSDSIPYTPAIVLQEATPTKDMPPASLVPSRPTSMGHPPSNTYPPPSPALSDITVSPLNLNVPQVQDERLQHFFNEVANQLNTMNIRSSVTSGSSRDSAILGSDYQAYLAYANGSPTVRPLSIATNNTIPLNTSSVDPNQFADADDDETIDTASIISHTYATPTPQSPLVGLGIGGPPPASHGGRPGLYPTQSTQTSNPQRWSYASSTVSSSTTQYRGPSNGSSSYSAVEPPSPSINTPHISWSPAPPIETLQATRPAPIAPTRIAPPRPVSVVKSAIEREGSYVVIDGSDLPASDPSLTSWGSKQSGFSAHRGSDGFGMLKKKKKGKLFWSLVFRCESLIWVV